jgi:hypothetical protein
MKKLLVLFLFAAPVFAQTPFIPAVATLPQATVNTTYPATIQTTLCVDDTPGGGCTTSYAGTLTGFNSALADAITNRATWGSTGAIEIRIDPALTLTKASAWVINSCGAATTEIIIRTDSNSMPAQGTRITAADYVNMPILETTGTNISVFEIGYPHTGVGRIACKVRTMGLNMRKAAGVTGQYIIQVGQGTPTTAAGAGTLSCVGVACSTSSAHGRAVDDYACVPTCSAGTANWRLITAVADTTNFTVLSAFASDPSASAWQRMTGPQDTAAEAPDGIIIDRSHIGCDASQICQKGIGLASSTSAVVDSIIDGMKDNSGDTNAVFINNNAPGPIRVDNNELSSAGESFLIGGSGIAPSSKEQINPVDISITRNYIHMYPTCPSLWTCKNIAELKAGKRVLFEGNIFQFSRIDGQSGQGIKITTTTSGFFMPYVETGDVTLRYSIIRDLEGWCVSISANPGSGQLYGNVATNHITIHDILCDGASNALTTAAPAGSIGTVACTSATGCPAAADDVSSSINISHITVIVTARVNANIKGGWANFDSTVLTPLTRCSKDFALHAAILPLTWEGATSANSSYANCKVNGADLDSQAWSHDYDSFHDNWLTNATAAALTPTTLKDRAMSTNALGRSIDQCSLFVSCIPASIGTGANNYTLATPTPTFDSATRIAAGLSGNVGADIAKINTETCGTLIGNWTACTGQPAPTVSSITPTSGTHLGGTDVTDLAGTGFIGGTPGSLATFGGVAGVNCVVVSSIKITCETPAHAAGAVDVVVTNPDLQSATLAGGYTYTGSGAATIVIVSPTTGSFLGGTPLRVTGTNLAQGLTILVGGQTCGSVSVVGTTLAYCTVPPSVTLGLKDVVVTNPGGSPITASNAFTYTNVIVTGVATPH